jgi:hypothetical protein
VLAKVLRFVSKVIRSVGYCLVALWLAAFYGFVGDIEGFEKWARWFDGRHRG